MNSLEKGAGEGGSQETLKLSPTAEKYLALANKASYKGKNKRPLPSSDSES